MPTKEAHHSRQSYLKGQSYTYYRRFSESQAEAVSAAQRDSLSQALDNQLATKADITRLENKLENLELRLTLKMGGMMVVSIGIIATLIKLL